MSTLSELQQYFYQKGETYNRNEVAAILATSVAASKGNATTATNPGITAAGSFWFGNAPGTYANFKDNTGTAITIPSPAAGHAIINIMFFSAGSYYQATWTDVTLPASVIADGAVVPAKTSFFAPGKNLFNLAAATSGFFVNGSTGVVSASASYYLSEYIPVTGSTAYARTHQYQLAYYDSSKTFVSGLTTTAGTPDTFTTPSTVAYVRVSVNVANINVYQLELGTVSTAYQPYVYNIAQSALPPITPQAGSVAADRIQTNAVTPHKMSIMTIGKNIFDKTSVTAGSYINGATGGTLTNASYSFSSYIPVVPSTAYAINDLRPYAFYDINRNFISGSTSIAGGAATFSAPASAYFIRVSVLNSGINTYQLEAGSSSTTYAAFSALINPGYLPTLPITDGSVTTAKLADASVAALKTAFIVTGKNIFNPNDSGVEAGKFINSTTGASNTNASYNASGFMQVAALTTYTISYQTHGAFYDANKAFIAASGFSAGGITNGIATSPAGAVYMRVSISLAHATGFQVEQGATGTAYEAYNYQLKSADGVPFNINSLVTALPTVEIDLSSQLYAVVGVEKNVYFDGLISATCNLSELDIDITCSKGQQFKDFYRVTPASTDTGTFTFSIAVYFNGIVLASASGNLVIAAANAAATRKILMVGDSTLAGGQVLSPILNDYPGNGYNQTFLGTQGSGSAKHEGRSGWKSSDFSTVGRTLFRFNLSGVTIAPGVGAIYSNNLSQFTVSEVNLSAGSGYINCTRSSGTNDPTLTASTLTKVSGSGDASLSYSSAVVGSGNPFWNSGTGAMDFQNYLTVNSYTMASGDLVVIHLGINDVFGYIDDATAIAGAATFIANIEIIMTAMRAAVSGLRFGICLPIAPAKSQDAFAASYGTGQTLKRYERNRHILVKALIANYDTSAKRTAGYYLVGYNACTDRVNNYQNAAAAPVNARNTATTIVRQNNGVHPDTPGYYQMGDVLYSFLKNMA